MTRSISATSSGSAGSPMSKPTAERAIIQRSAARAISIGSSVAARAAASRAAARAPSRSPRARAVSLRSTANSARSLGSVRSVMRASTRSHHLAESSYAPSIELVAAGGEPGGDTAHGGRSEPASKRWWASVAGDHCGSLACSRASAMRRWRSSRRVRPSRASTACPIRAWGIARRPAPSSTSSPTASAVSAASRRRSPSSPLASSSTGSVAAGPATAVRLSTWVTGRVEAVEPHPDHRPDRVRSSSPSGRRCRGG